MSLCLQAFARFQQILLPRRNLSIVIYHVGNMWAAGGEGRQVALLVAQRWILARLRHETFFSLEELNARIAELLDELNRRTMRLYQASRRELFERLDQPALRPGHSKCRRFQVEVSSESAVQGNRELVVITSVIF